MGALTINRKRSDEFLPYSHGISNSPNFQNPKRPRFLSPSMNRNPDRSAIAVSSKSSVSRVSRYPEAKPPLPRLLAPCGNNRFGPNHGISNRNSITTPARDSGDVMGNVLFSNFEKAKTVALDVCRYIRKKEEVVEVDDVGASEDSSVEEIEVIEDDEDGEKTRESDAKVRERGNERSSCSVDSDLSNAIVKVEREGTSISVYKKLLKEVDKRTVKIEELDFNIKYNEQRLNLIQSLRPAKKPTEVIPPEPFIPLTKEEEAEVNRAFSTNRRMILVTHENSNIEITGQLLQCLRPGAWLNDEVINVYLELLKEREKRDPKKFLRCHFFNTFFYKKLTSGNGYDFKSVRRWTTQRKLGYGLINCDKIFVPVHREIHWCLAVINKKEQKFQYLDSLKGCDNRVTKVLARYYADEVKDKSGEDVDLSSWKHECLEDLPEQMNGFDCGVFMIKYADFYSRGLGLCFGQEHMPYFRLRTAKEILRLRAD